MCTALAPVRSLSSAILIPRRGRLPPSSVGIVSSECDSPSERAASSRHGSVPAGVYFYSSTRATLTRRVRRSPHLRMLGTHPSTCHGGREIFAARGTQYFCRQARHPSIWITDTAYVFGVPRSPAACSGHQRTLHPAGRRRPADGRIWKTGSRSSAFGHGLVDRWGRLSYCLSFCYAAQSEAAPNVS